MKRLAIILVGLAVVYFLAFYFPARSSGNQRPPPPDPAPLEILEKAGDEGSRPAHAAATDVGQPGVASRDRSAEGHEGGSDARLRGRIVDDLGEPLAEVLVQTTPVNTDDLRNPTTSAADAAEAADAATRETVTDASGRFELAPLAANRGPRLWRRLGAQPWFDCVVVAHHPLFAPRILSDVHAVPGATIDLGDITLPSCAGLLVEVVHDSGLPVRDARVEIRPTVEHARLPAAARAARHRRAQTDAKGIATFYGVEPGAWILEIRSTGRVTTAHHRQPASPEVAPRTIVTVLSGQVLAGRVLDADDAPVESAWIHCRPAAESAQSGPSLETRTAGDGGFRIEGLADGLQRVTVASPNRGTTTLEAVDPSRGPQVFRLPRGQEIRGRVVHGRTRRPVVGAAVHATVDSGWPILRGGQLHRPSTTTDGDGNFVFSGLPPGIVTLTASSKGFCPETLGPLPPPTTPSRRESVVLTLDEGARVIGQILSPSAGLPLQDAVIHTLRLPNRPAKPTARTGAGGRFELKGLPPGRYRLVVESAGLPPFWTEDFAAERNGRIELGALRLQRGGSIHGRALTKSGDPAVGATVHLIRRGDIPPALGGLRMKSDHHGHFRAPVVAPGEYRMFYDYPDKEPRAAAECRRATRVRVRIEAGKDPQQDLRPRIR